MNATPSTQVPYGVRKEIEAGQTRYFVALLNLLFVMAVGSLMFFGMVSGPGLGPEQMSDDIILISIRICCILGGLIAACAWLFSWFQLLGLKRQHAALLSQDGSA